MFIIAEIGINHNGRLDDARALLEAAAKAGADAVKCQLFSAREMVSRTAPGVSHDQAQGMLELFRSLELPPASWQELRRLAADLGLLFGCSIFDFKALEWAQDLQLDFFKVASGEITNRPLLAAAFPLCEEWIISTGASRASEIAELLEWLKDMKRPEPILLECTAAYPALPEQIFLGNIAWLKETFAVQVGLSDHSQGLHIPLAAVACGAQVIEKHFTLDCHQPGPDHSLSMDPAEFTAMVTAIREVEKALGLSRKQTVPAWEEESRSKGRKSVVADRDLTAGTVLKRSDLALKRPGMGISPLRIDELPDRRLRCDVLADQLLNWQMLE